MRLSSISLLLLFVLAAATPAGAATPEQAKILKGVWKVDPHKTLAGIGDKRLRDHWQRKFKEYDTDAHFLMLAFDPDEGICKSATMSYAIGGISVLQDGRTVVVQCNSDKLILTPDSGTELRQKITNDLYFHYRKFEDDPARFYKNWRAKGQGRSAGEMFLFALYDPPAWMDKRNMPATPAETKPATPAPQSSAAPSGKGGGLARLGGDWYFDLEASVARYPKRETDLETASLVKMSIDVSAKKLVVHTEHRDKPKESDLVVLFDDGNRVVIKNGQRSDNVSFSIVNDDTIIVEEKDFGYVFTRKEPHADVLARLDGVWHMDLAATTKRNPDQDFKGVEASTISFDTRKKAFNWDTQINGKASNMPTKRLVVKSTGPQSAVIAMNGEDMQLDFSDTDTLVLFPVSDPKRAFVFTRTAAPADARSVVPPADAQTTTPPNTQTSAAPATPADVLPRLDGVWNLDVKASEEQSRNAPWGKLDAFSLSFDVQKKRFETTDTASGKRLFAGPFSLKAAGESVVLVRNAVETYCSFADNDTLILSLVDEPQKRLVFTRAK